MSFVEQSEKRGGLARRAFLFCVLGVLSFLIGGFIWATATPGDSYSGPPAKPDEPALSARLESHVVALSTGQRNLERLASVTTAVTYIEEQLTALGYQPQRQAVVTPADNLIITVPAAVPDAPTLVIGAHYDTAGTSPGADDNASGVAALIELARELKPLEGQGALRIEMVFYANEEPPYFKTNAMGSYVHALSIDDPETVVGMMSLETMGYFSDEPGSQNYPFPLSLRYPSTGNFIAFVGDTSSRAFLRETIGEFRNHAKVPSVGGTAPGIVQGITWSDHWGYSQVGIPAFMVTDTAPFRNPNYHRDSDTPDTLDYDKLALVVEALVKTVSAKRE